MTGPRRLYLDELDWSTLCAALDWLNTQHLPWFVQALRLAGPLFTTESSFIVAQ